jgi:hypothetical protein
MEETHGGSGPQRQQPLGHNQLERSVSKGTMFEVL